MIEASQLDGLFVNKGRADVVVAYVTHICAENRNRRKSEFISQVLIVGCLNVIIVQRNQFNSDPIGEKQ